MSASAKAVFEADSGKLDSALLRIQASMLKLQKVVVGAKLAFEALKVAGELIAEGFEHVKESFALGKELNELSARTGVAVGDLVSLREEFKNAGKSADDIGPVFNKMQKSIGTGASATVVREMGLDMKKLREMTPTEQFETLGKAINGLQSPTDRAQAAMAIFGKTGAELLPMFAEKGFGQVSKEMSNKAQILQRDAGLFADVTNSLRIIGDKVQGFWLGLADKIGPVIKPMLDGLKTLDFTRVGQQLGDIVATLIQMISDGSIIRVLGEALTLGGEVGFNAIATGFAELGDMLLEFITSAFTDSGDSAKTTFEEVADSTEDAMEAALWNAWDYFQKFVNSSLGGLGPLVGQELFEAAQIFVKACAVVTTGDFWAGVGSGLLAAGNSFIALIMDGMAYLLQKLAGIPKIGTAFAEAAGGARGMAADARSKSAGNDKDSDAAYTRAFAPLQKQLQDSMSAVIAKQPKGWENWSGFDTKPALDKLANSVAKEREATKRTTAKSLAESPTKQVNALGDSVLNTEKAQVSHLQKIGGGGYGGALTGDRAEQKKHTVLLDKIHTGIKEVRDKLGTKPSPGLSFGYP